MASIPQNLLDKFDKLCNQDRHAQCEYFLRSFIFALEDWKEVGRLSTTFNKYLSDYCVEEGMLDATQAADFLQKNGKTRTALQRKNELRDVDLNFDEKISFVEYLLLHYKGVILREYYKRHNKEPEEDLSNEAVGVTGVGEKLLEELFTLPIGLDPALEKAIEEFTAAKRAREDKMKDLADRAAQGGVKAMTAKNELAQMQSEDGTAMNRQELTLDAAKRKASKQSGDVALKQKQKAKEEEERQKKEESRQRLAARAAMFK
eukprot:CAMPEP_0119131374 /NCGR_PEP_ID=MMETSP1310-20130426/10189_1 /TAXON_ID=464262 /ORGANISM="Genus nov. species nov., Strain RCC2339" /LENGTH=260 /DNA_ID=CAMNT_0007121941 /DNA_START=102 /DNA_END=884 /DNA_ORIENTATION=+